jgi:hypothetical protein
MAGVWKGCMLFSMLRQAKQNWGPKNVAYRAVSYEQGYPLTDSHL